MTPTECKTALQAFAKEVGPRAEVYIHLNSHGEPKALRGMLYPEGICNASGYLTDTADDFVTMLAWFRTEWEKHKATHSNRTVRKMALAIIQITADHGWCTDAALRGADFSRDEIGRYGSEACADATIIAGNAPFSIQFNGGANQ